MHKIKEWIICKIKKQLNIASPSATKVVIKEDGKTVYRDFKKYLKEIQMEADNENS